MKNKYFTLLLFIFCACAQAERDQEEPSGLEKLASKMNDIGDYYQKVNDKLNPTSKNQNNTDYIRPNKRRDPFSYTDKMYRNQRNQNTMQTGVNTGNNLASNALLLATTTAFTADGLPIMKYRGFAESADGEVIGILEILGMGVYTVRIGDQIGLHDIVKELVLTIEGLSRNNIIIKTGKLGKKLVVQ